MAGCLPKVSNLYPPVQYPVSRGTASLSSLVTWNHEDTLESLLEMDTSKLEGFTISVDHNFTICLDQNQDRMLAGHKIDGKIYLPLSYLLTITWNLFCSKLRKKFTETSVMFQNLHVHQNIEIPEKGDLNLCTFLQKDSGIFEIVLDGETLILSGRILLPENKEEEFNKTVTVSSENAFNLTSNEVYNEMESRGYQYQDHFRGILNAQVSEQGCISKVQWRNNWCSFIDSLIQVVLFSDGESSQEIYLPLDIRQITINPCLHVEPQDIEVVYQKMTSIVKGGGVEILGLTSYPADTFQNNDNNVKLKSLNFLSNSSPRLKMLEQFVEVTLEIVYENTFSIYNKKSAIIELKEDYPFEPLSQHVIKRLKEFPGFREYVSTVSLDNAIRMLSSASSIGLLITPIDTLEKCVGLVDNSSNFILARSIGKQTPKISDGLVVIIEQQFDNEKLLLLRKAVSVEEKAPVVFLAGDECNWPQQLKSELNISNGYNKRVYVVIKTKAPIDGKTLIQQLSKEPKADKLRYILILGENAPNFSLSEDIYLQQLQQDLVCNVYCDGSWGSFRQLPYVLMLKVPFYLSALPALRLKNINISFVGLNLRDPHVSDSVKEKAMNDMGNLELSGTLEDGRRVMSIVQNTKDPIHNSLDPHLTWDIPESWSLEDAATVPWAYSTAYHGMIQGAALSSEETVLIHAGHTPIGQAAIAFALHIGSTVFTTIAEIVHKEFLMKRFPLRRDRPDQNNLRREDLICRRPPTAATGGRQEHVTGGYGLRQQGRDFEHAVTVTTFEVAEGSGGGKTASLSKEGHSGQNVGSRKQ
uniref:PKS/mFAS DH domain-containing protein n=1 Tax=Timema bartmani TaxID=61472 RepID=A0A7R9I2N6_9NEOP|nr:unnamed protein product [Timema bartmani]